MISQDIRSEALQRADKYTYKILQDALQNVESNRFARLRKHQVLPTNEKEEAYVLALGMYVKNKLNLARYKRRSHIPWTILSGFQKEMSYWRIHMDIIEFGAPLKAYRTLRKLIPSWLSSPFQID